MTRVFGQQKMTIKILNEQQVIQEALQVLLTHLDGSKVARFLAACQLGTGNYIQLKEQLFADETVASLYDKIQAYQTSSEP
jgi:predicted LPLAT superfamily acyltransferase